GAIVSAVVLLPDGPRLVPIVERRESANGRALGLLLDVPVLPGHGPAGDPVFVRIEARRGQRSGAGELERRAVPELQLEADDILETAKMAERYSEINVTGGARIQGIEPARLVATYAIRINGPVDASGEHAGGVQGGPGGPGGCPGGAG